jgi:hypothetical protein
MSLLTLGQGGIGIPHMKSYLKVDQSENLPILEQHLPLALSCKA